jgi:hypothetical protein
MNSFNTEELNLLIEALETWESAEITSGMFASVVTAGLTARETTREQAIQQVKKEMDEAHRKTGIRRERSTLMKAKLIQMKQSLAADRLLKEATRDEPATH